MKILSAGDLHGDSGLAKKLADRALKEDVDLVILCGDLTHADEKTDNIIGIAVFNKFYISTIFYCIC